VLARIPPKGKKVDRKIAKGEVAGTRTTTKTTKQAREVAEEPRSPRRSTRIKEKAAEVDDGENAEEQEDGGAEGEGAGEGELEESDDEDPPKLTAVEAATGLPIKESPLLNDSHVLTDEFLSLDGLL
jgi:hypothetical protein